MAENNKSLTPNDVVQELDPWQNWQEKPSMLVPGDIMQTLDLTKIVSQPSVHITTQQTRNPDLILTTNVLLDKLTELGARVDVKGGNGIGASIEITWDQYDCLFMNDDAQAPTKRAPILPALHECLYLMSGFAILEKLSMMLQLIRAHIALGSLLPQMRELNWTWEFVHYKSKGHPEVVSYADARISDSTLKENWHAILIQCPHYQVSQGKQAIIVNPRCGTYDYCDINEAGVRDLAAQIAGVRAKAEFEQYLPEFEAAGLSVKLNGTTFSVIMRKGDPELTRECNVENIQWIRAIAKALHELQLNQS